MSPSFVVSAFKECGVLLRGSRVWAILAFPRGRFTSNGHERRNSVP